MRGARHAHAPARDQSLTASSPVPRRGQCPGEGRLRATVTQICIVSLDDFPRGGGGFHRPLRARGTEEEEPDIDSMDEIPFTGLAIDLGRRWPSNWLWRWTRILANRAPRWPRSQWAPENPFARLAALRRATNIHLGMQRRQPRLAGGGPLLDGAARVIG